MYSAYSRLDKDPKYTGFANQELAPFGAIKHDVHHVRRAALNKSFSPTSVARILPLLRERTRVLLDRLSERQQQGQPETLGDAYKSFATDVINAYALPHAPLHLENRDFEAVYNKSIRQILTTGFIHTHFPFVWQTFETIPLWLLKRTVASDQYAVLEHVDLLKRNSALIAKTNGDPPDDKSRKWPLILNELYNNPSLPLHEKTERHMTHSAQALTAAGGETSGTTLSVMTYHLLQNPDKLQRLREEIASIRVLDDPSAEITSYKDFEKLPYLNACITEGLRIACPVSGRLGRVNPNQATTYGKYTIPPGYIVSMSLTDLHYDLEVFGPDPWEFKPERWLVGTDERRRLERYWAPFSRGTRSCAGQNLAMAELQIVLGNVMACFGGNMELFETTFEDVGLVYEIFVPCQHPKSLGLRVLVK